MKCGQPHRAHHKEEVLILVTQLVIVVIKTLVRKQCLPSAKGVGEEEGIKYLFLFIHIFYNVRQPRREVENCYICTAAACFRLK